MPDVSREASDQFCNVVECWNSAQSICRAGAGPVADERFRPLASTTRVLPDPVGQGRAVAEASCAFQAGENLW